MFSKQVILDGVMLGAWSHVSWFKTGEGELIDIIFMNFDMHVSNVGIWNV
jgi:hypothetical protein